MLDGVPPQEWAAHPLGGADALRAVLREAAERGYAVDDGYGEPDVRSVAAPVLDETGQVVGAVGVSGLTFTLDEESVRLFGPMVRAAARAVSAGLGGRAPSLGVVGRSAEDERDRGAEGERV